MDLGVFRRNRMIFLAWILCPLLLITAVHVATVVYRGRAGQAMEDRKQALALVPGLQQRLRVADETLDGFVVEMKEGQGAAEYVGDLVSRAAQESGFVVNALTVDSDRVRERPSGVAVDVTIKGESPYRAVLRFVNELQRPEHLVTLRDASFSATRVVPELQYSATLTCRFYVLTQETVD